MNSAPHKAAISILITGFLLSACGGSLWGSYASYTTPTAAAPLPATVTATVKPVPISTATQADPPLPSTPAPVSTFTAAASPTLRPATTSQTPPLTYTSQSGDSLEVIAIHFGVKPDDILSPSPLPETGFVDPGTLMFIPDALKGVATTPSDPIIPDSELVDSPSAVGFDIQAFVDNAGGKLSSFHEYMMNVGTITGAAGVERISLGSSISPRLLLALIQYYTGWVQGDPKPNLDEKKLLDYDNPSYPGLYQQMRLMVQDLLTGYYSWRAGTLTEITFPDGEKVRLAPSLNAGSVAIQYMFSKHYNQAEWLQVINPDSGFTSLYEGLFGDPFVRAEELGPLFPPQLNQPTFTLPFEVGSLWAFTGGPHPAWEQETALAALDFAPASPAPGCITSNAWVVAIAPGWIVRSEIGFVVLDMDGDGFEQTGWDVLYQHISTKDRIATGTRVAAGDHIGHPSCEGGLATGTHVHITRKYNGEWVAAGGPVPFTMSGWTAHAGNAPYKGTLTKGDKVIIANQSSTHESQIIRQAGE